MKFECKKISIDDSPFGCTVSFYDRKPDYEAQINMTTQEIIDSLGQYVMLQRTYPEDEFESDYYHFETNLPNIGGELNDFKIILSRTKFWLEIGGQKIELVIKLIDKKFEDLSTALENIVNKKEELIIEE